MKEEVQIEEHPLPDARPVVRKSRPYFGLVTFFLATVLVLSIIGGAYYYFIYTPSLQEENLVVQSPNPETQTTTNPTAGWKIYRNEKYSFEIKYPTDWYAKEDGEFSLLFGQGEEPKEILPSTHGWPDLYIDIGILHSNKDLIKDIIEQGASIEEGSEPLNKRKYEPIIFNGVSANKKIQLTSDLIGDEQTVRIIFNHKGYGWIIEYPISDLVTGKTDPIYDQILSTFKFTDQVVDTSNWKTYTSNTFNYQIKHPNLLEDQCNVGGLLSSDKLDKVLAQGQPRADSEYCGIYTISIFIDEDKNSQIQQKIDKFIAYKKEMFNLTEKDYSITNTNIGGLPATKLLITSNSIQSSIIYFFEDPSTKKIFYIMIGNNSSETQNKEIDQVLSTFRFVN